MIATSSWRALGTGITVAVADPSALAQAVAIVEHELACIDLACSRFRADSDLVHMNRNAGAWVKISPLLAEALAVALRAAELTDGLVDPTIGRALIAAGYDDDFDRIPKSGPATQAAERQSSRYQQLRLDSESQRAWIPSGVAVDLGSTAKALAADRAAAAVYTVTGSAALVGCGGDLSVSGPAPEDGWLVSVAERHAADTADETIAITAGGVATSGTVGRRWMRGEREMHHIIDPRTGEPAITPWRVATVAAATCVDANIASTAAIVKGEEARPWLEAQALSARLVRNDGTVVRVGDWPA